MLFAPPNTTASIVQPHKIRPSGITYCQFASHLTKRQLVNPATSGYKQIRRLTQHLSWSFQFGTVSRPPYRMTGTLRCPTALLLLRHAYVCAFSVSLVTAVPHKPNLSGVYSYHMYLFHDPSDVTYPAPSNYDVPPDAVLSTSVCVCCYLVPCPVQAHKPPTELLPVQIALPWRVLWLHC